MVKLPDSSNLRRNIPQATSAIQNVPVAMDFQAMQDAGQQLQQTGNRLFAQQQRDALYEQRQQKELLRQQEKQDNEIKKFQIAQAKSQYDIEADNIVASLADEQDFTQYQTKLDNDFKALNERMSKSLPDDPIAKGYIGLHFNERYNNARLKTHELQKQKQTEAIKGSVYNFTEQFKQQYVSANSEQQKSLNNNLDFLIDSALGTGAIDKEQAEILKNNTRQDAERNRLKSLTPQQIIDETDGHGVKSDFNSVMDYIFQEEGGYVAKDGRSNAPALFGINRKHNPDLYDKVKSLYDAGNIKQAKLEASVGYKDRYWDAVNADSLPENMRLLAMDTAVNQGVSVAQELIDKSNSDPVKFTELRLQKYKNLNQPENIDAWEQRANKSLNAVIGNKNSTYSALPKSEIIKAREQAIKEHQEIKEKKQIDEITSIVFSKYPDNYEAQVKTINGLEVPFDQRKKIMSILDSNKKRQEVIKRDNAEQLSYKAIEYINGGGLFENMPADMAIQLNSSQRTYLQSYSDKVNNKEGNKAKLKQSELLEYTKVTSLISSGDIEALKKEYPPEKAVTLLNTKHYEQYLKAINPQQNAQSTLKATQQEENRRISAVFNSIGIADKRNNGQALQQGLFYDKYYDAREAFINDNGRQPKGSEIQDILDGLVKERVVGVGLFGYGSDITKMEFEITDKDIPIPSEAEKESILSALLKKDPKRDWSDEDVQKVYNVMRGKK